MILTSFSSQHQRPYCSSYYQNLLPTKSPHMMPHAGLVLNSIILGKILSWQVEVTKLHLHLIDMNHKYYSSICIISKNRSLKELWEEPRCLQHEGQYSGEKKHTDGEPNTSRWFSPPEIHQFLSCINQRDRQPNAKQKIAKQKCRSSHSTRKIKVWAQNKPNRMRPGKRLGLGLRCLKD